MKLWGKMQLMPILHNFKLVQSFVKWFGRESQNRRVFLSAPWILLLLRGTWSPRWTQNLESAKLSVNTFIYVIQDADHESEARIALWAIVLPLARHEMHVYMKNFLSLRWLENFLSPRLAISWLDDLMKWVYGGLVHNRPRYRNVTIYEGKSLSRCDERNVRERKSISADQFMWQWRQGPRGLVNAGCLL
jgi:hypothetical protein